MLRFVWLLSFCATLEHCSSKHVNQNELGFRWYCTAFTWSCPRFCYHCCLWSQTQCTRSTFSWYGVSFFWQYFYFSFESFYVCGNFLSHRTLAGSTIMLLTLAWGGSLFLGRCDLDRNGEAIELTGKGVNCREQV